MIYSININNKLLFVYRLNPEEVFILKNSDKFIKEKILTIESLDIARLTIYYSIIY